jgi:hypothetical protein
MSSTAEITRETSLQCLGVRRGLPGKTGAVAGLDGRRRAAKRLRVIAADIEGQLPAPLTAAMRAMVKRASELALAAEMARGQLVRGEAVDVVALVRLENLAGRALRDLHNRAGARGPAPVESFADIAARAQAAANERRAIELAADAEDDDGAAA